MVFYNCSSEEKIDEYLQQFANESSCWTQSTMTPNRQGEESPYHALLKEVSTVLSERNLEGNSVFKSSEGSAGDMPEECDRLMWQSINVLSNSRPPASFMVFDHKGGAAQKLSPHLLQQQQADGQPLFDGSVANATPPPLGPPGVLPSAGAGTLLHLACAVDSPFALSVFLALGADARSPHTAFRRFMIHEACCAGSIQCLTLLLELGKECALQLYKEEDLKLPTPHLEEHSFHSDLPFFPTDFEPDSKPMSLPKQSKPSFGLPKKPKVPETRNWLEKLRHFFDLAKRVRLGSLSELDAARTVLAYDTITTPTRQIIAQSCSFLVKDSTMSGNPFKCPWFADGHGNTPLHWASFKNERECVSMLLKYHANPNARAHPSGWSALHDAAYSNSSESVELLLDAGADVDIQANSGATPLCFASQEDADGAARLLLERGADLSIRCAGGPRSGEGAFIPHPNGRFSGYTPLHYCAHYNAHRAARVLLAHPSSQAAMEVADLSDRLPIHVAVARGSSDVLRELLRAGARIETPTAPSSPKRRSTRSNSRSGTPPRIRGVPEMPSTPTGSTSSDDGSTASVASPVLRAMIPARPINSSKPWNCLTQQAIDECKALILQAEQNWAPDRHLLFTPADRRAVMELLRVGKRLEQMGTGIFIDLWPLVLGFCGRGWFEIEADDEFMDDADAPDDSKMPALSQDMEDAVAAEEEIQES
jgi:hypothetical protein